MRRVFSDEHRVQCYLDIEAALARVQAQLGLIPQRAADEITAKCTLDIIDMAKRPGVGDFARDYDETVRGMASHFIWLNRSKESLTLDLKHPEARQIVQQLLEGADVFIQNLAPGATERLGLGPEVLAQRYLRLIVCDVSGYGSSGPYRDKKAYDLLVQCETGLVSVTGTPETPSKVGISIADISAGMYAFTGILTALYQ